jgi:hypothetical protein
MKSIFCALGIMAGCLGVVSLSGCSEDNDKTAKITSVPQGSDPGVKVPTTPEEQKRIADEQQKKQMGGGAGYTAPSLKK